MSELKVIGRLSRERYLHKNKLVERTVFTLLKRKSSHDLSAMIDDAYFDIKQIDFSKYKNGIYQLKRINESRDIESGMIDDWELTLVEAEENGTMDSDISNSGSVEPV
jgi:hypothetical protein